MAYDARAAAQYIRQAAIARGIDPDVALRVAESEGLNSYTGDNNSSFGPYQLHYGNVATGGNAVAGLGDDFTNATGLDARNPDTVPQQINFALDAAKRGGWGPFHGHRGNIWDGIGDKSSTPVDEKVRKGLLAEDAPDAPKEGMPEKPKSPDDNTGEEKDKDKSPTTSSEDDPLQSLFGAQSGSAYAAQLAERNRQQFAQQSQPQDAQFTPLGGGLLSGEVLGSRADAQQIGMKKFTPVSTKLITTRRGLLG